MSQSTAISAPAQLWRLAAGTELRRNVVETYGVRLLVVAISFGTTIISSRVLGPTGRGYYAVAMTLGAIGVQFGNMGLHASNTYFVSKDRGLLPALLGNTLAVVVAASVLTAIWGIFVVIFPRFAPIHGLLLLLALVSVPAGLAYLLSQGLLLGVNEVRAYNGIEGIGKFLALALTALAALIHYASVELLFSFTLLSIVFSFVWGLLHLRRTSTARPVISTDVFRQSLRIGVKAYVIAFFGFLLIRVDLLMVNSMLGAEQAGYYSISRVLSENTMMFPVVLGLILFPKLSALKDEREKFTLTKKAAGVTAALMLPVVILAVLVAAPVISLAFGRTYLPAVSPFVWLMPGIYFLGLEVVLVQLLNSEGFPPVIVVAWIGAVVVNIALNFWAIPHFGMAGASVSSSICYFLMFAVIAVIVWNRRPKCA
jgi:O-antigen/teichoic acid export membrane protein